MKFILKSNTIVWGTNWNDFFFTFKTWRILFFIPYAQLLTDFDCVWTYSLWIS